MARRMTAADAGELLFDAWFGAGDKGMSRAETMKLTGLTDKQFRTGKDYLRSMLTLDHLEPFSYDPAANVYRMNTEPERVREYYVGRLKIAAKQSLRLLSGTLIPHSKKLGNRQSRRVVRDAARHLEDLLDLLSVNGEDVATMEAELEDALNR